MQIDRPCSSADRLRSLYIYAGKDHRLAPHAEVKDKILQIARRVASAGTLVLFGIDRKGEQLYQLKSSLEEPPNASLNSSMALCVFNDQILAETSKASFNAFEQFRLFSGEIIPHGIELFKYRLETKLDGYLALSVIFERELSCCVIKIQDQICPKLHSPESAGDLHPVQSAVLKPLGQIDGLLAQMNLEASSTVF